MNKFNAVRCPHCESVIRWLRLSFTVGDKEASVFCTKCRRVFDASAWFTAGISDYSTILVERRREMMKCLTGWVAILPETVAMSPEGIAYPENKRPVRTEGNVVSVGPRAEGVKRGDRVIFGGKSGDLFTVDKTKYIIIDHEAVFAVIKEAADNDTLQEEHFPVVEE